jgi:hypothetical protein
MKGFRAYWKIIVILCVSSLLTSGCVTKPSDKNVTSSLPSIYTAPIGGFDKGSAVLEPNTIFETEYTFYSRDWGPGEVKYTLEASYVNGSYINRSYWCCEYPLHIDLTQLHIEPSTFFAEPNHTYKSRIFLNTSALPEDFLRPIDWVNGGVYSPVNLSITVNLPDNSTHFANHKMSLIQPRPTSGAYPRHRLTIDNCSIVVNRGETRSFNTSFFEDPRYGIKKISFIPSSTPLNFTITPSEYIAKHFLEFPSRVSNTAHPLLAQGQYPLNITINGTGLATMVECRDNTDANVMFGEGYTPNIFTFNVTVV